MEERHGWVLATFLQRLAAFAIDTVLFKLPLLILALVLFFALFFAVAVEVVETGSDGTVIIGRDDSEAWENGGLLAVIVVALGSLAVSAGYVVWWLFTLRHGQTPGKHLVGIRVIKNNGELSDWGYTFLRELVIKGLVGGLLSGMTGGIYFVVDHLWPLFDSDRQALHDKMVETLVVKDRR